jgi:hypothetical protein
MGGVDGPRRSGLRYVALGRGRSKEEENFLLCEKGTPVAFGKLFKGRGSLRPWVEAYILLGEFQDEWKWAASARAERIMRTLVKMLPLGGRIMLPYAHLPTTARLLERGFPPPLTPLGMLMLRYGLTSFKDWYFAEGFYEGDVKLQGEIPESLDMAQARLARLASECESFIEKEQIDREAQVLEALAFIERMKMALTQSVK